MKMLKSLPRVMILMLFITACSTHHPLELRVDANNYKQAKIGKTTTGIKSAEPYRFWGSEAPGFLYDPITNSTPLKTSDEQLNILVLSGGGANGAYGAGIINGLYDNNKLPDYSIITGISAGSLIAPFTFLGGEQIANLKDTMLSINDDMLLGKENFLNTLIKDAFTDGESLYGLIESTYTKEIIDQIALEHQKGRRLFIGTTQFDSGELMVWNIGRIAESDIENKYSLIHQILTASASIPGVFPPQFIRVNVNGEILEELHVDGGMNSQMFFDPGNFNYSLVNDALAKKRPPQIHIIRNGMLKSAYEELEDKGLPLLTRSLNSLTVQQARGDLFRMLYSSEINHYNLSFTYIDDKFNAPKSTDQMFDPAFMQALYNSAYDKATSDKLWQKTLPY
ncbi:patatin-like phospholipase family protein [Shewanella donghaensis]|uniref:patatin-like phospholipase family protein n=1 Tax=Shewanella donghaensis TaxID=238836 RepID=UPI0011833424|nr:patatin-like phospholipase family protein [Shewanella donghaensis]